MTGERRNTRRGFVQAPVRYMFKDEVRHGFSTSVSTGGMFLVTDDPLPVGTVIELEFSLPNSDVAIQARAEVRWARLFDPARPKLYPGMGLMFIPKSARDESVPRGNPNDSQTTAAISTAALMAGKTPSPPRAGAPDAVPHRRVVPKQGEIRRPPGAAEPRTARPKAVPQPQRTREKRIQEPQAVAPPPQPEADENAGEDKQRNWPRFFLRVQIDMETPTNFYVGYSENISRGGLFVATYDPLPVGEVLGLSFALPHVNQAFNIAAKVCWNQEYNPNFPNVQPGMGVRFTNLTLEEERHLTYFIRKIREPYFYPHMEDGGDSDDEAKAEDADD